MAAAHLVEIELSGPSGHRGQRRIEWRVLAIRPLRVVRARSLPPLNGLRAAVQKRSATGSAKLVGPALEAEQRVAGRRKRVAGIDVGERTAGLEIAMHVVDDEA